MMLAITACGSAGNWDDGNYDNDNRNDWEYVYQPVQPTRLHIPEIQYTADDLIVSTDGETLAIRGEVIVLAAEGVDFWDIQYIMDQTGGTLMGYIEALGFYHAIFDIPDYIGLENKIYELLDFWAVEMALPNTLTLMEGSATALAATATPANFSLTWWQDAIELEAAWNIMAQVPHSTARIGVWDRGFYPNHPNLMIPAGNTRVHRTGSHGTAVTGIIASLHGSGLNGVVPNRDIFFACTAMRTNFSDIPNDLRTSLFDLQSPYLTILEYNYWLRTEVTLIYGFTWLAENHDVSVINVSTVFNDESMYHANMRTGWRATFLYRFVQRYDILIVAGAGNNARYAHLVFERNQRDDDGNIETRYISSFAALVYRQPALADYVLIVGAIGLPWEETHRPLNYEIDNFTLDGAYSSIGPFVTIAAPGSFIYTTFPPYQSYHDELRAESPSQFYVESDDLHFGTVSGTSFATPIVAGVAALVRQANPDITASEVREILVSYAPRWVPDAFGYAYPMVNARLAVETALARRGIFVDVAPDITYIPGTDSDIVYTPAGAAFSDIQGMWNLDGFFYGDSLSLDFESEAFVRLYISRVDNIFNYFIDGHTIVVPNWDWDTEDLVLIWLPNEDVLYAQGIGVFRRGSGGEPPVLPVQHLFPSHFVERISGVSDEHLPSLTIHDDGHFTFVVNLFAGMGTVHGFVALYDDIIVFVVTNRDFSGVIGDDVHEFAMQYAHNTLTLVDDTMIGITELGSVFHRTD